MNKQLTSIHTQKSGNLKKSLIAIVGALNEVQLLFTPIILLLFWKELFGATNFGFYLLVGVAIGSTIYRSIRNLIK